MSSFINFLQLVRTEFTSDEQIIIACPSQEQIAVTITSLQLQPKTPRSSVSRQRSETPREDEENVNNGSTAEKEKEEVANGVEESGTGAVTVDAGATVPAGADTSGAPGIGLQDQISIAKPVSVPTVMS